MTNEKIVGVLGGMGPEATVDFMQRVIRLTPAKDDSDHIRMIIDNNPKVPSRIKRIIEKSGEDPAPVLKMMAQQLQEHGANFLVIPCNTAHYYLEEIQSAVSIPVLNMIALTLERILRENPRVRTIGLLASTAVILTDLFGRYGREKGIRIHYPEDRLQNRVLDTIRQIKAARWSDRNVEAVQTAGDSLVNAGADAIIIGCTELSLIAERLQFPIPVYDSAQVLAEETVVRAKASGP